MTWVEIKDMAISHKLCKKPVKQITCSKVTARVGSIKWEVDSAGWYDIRGREIAWWSC